MSQPSPFAGLFADLRRMDADAKVARQERDEARALAAANGREVVRLRAVIRRASETAASLARCAQSPAVASGLRDMVARLDDAHRGRPS